MVANVSGGEEDLLATEVEEKTAADLLRIAAWQGLIDGADTGGEGRLGGVDVRVDAAAERGARILGQREEEREVHFCPLYRTGWPRA